MPRCIRGSTIAAATNNAAAAAATASRRATLTVDTAY